SDRRETASGRPSPVQVADLHIGTHLPGVRGFPRRRTVREDACFWANSNVSNFRKALGLAARGASPTAFGRRCIPAGCVASPSNMVDILGRRALPSGRLAALGATPDFHHGLLVSRNGRN